MQLDQDTLLKIYRTMVAIRNFEELGVYEMGQRRLSASVHSSAGEEAVPTRVRAHLTDSDYISSTHRGHGHCIAKGVDPKLMMAELFVHIPGLKGVTPCDPYTAKGLLISAPPSVTTTRWSSSSTSSSTRRQGPCQRSPTPYRWARRASSGPARPSL